MSTIHNPSNFNPADYEVIDYLDNKRPEYCGGSVEDYAQSCAFWEEEMTRFFPGWKNGAPSIHRCAHCGNTLIRYIACVRYIPTGENVVFGSDCVEKCSFKNRDELKAAQLRAKAELAHERVKVYRQYCDFLIAHPEVKAALAELENEIHKGNAFAHDVANKLRQYGSLSVRQMECLVLSLKRDHEKAAQKAVEAAEVKGDAPEGRAEIEGVIVFTRCDENDFGTSYKMLVKLDNNAKVWSTIPNSFFDGNISVQDMKGLRVAVKATWTRKPEDKSFAFGKRPNGRILEAKVTA